MQNTNFSLVNSIITTHIPVQKSQVDSPDSELFVNYVISPGREFADGRRIRGQDPNSPEFGIVSPSP